MCNINLSVYYIKNIECVMLVEITGQGMSIGANLHKYVEEEIDLIKKYLPNAIDVKIVITKQSFYFHTHIIINPGIKKSNALLVAEEEAKDPYDSFDGALRRIKGKIRRFKDKLKHKHATDEDLQEREKILSHNVDINDYIIHYEDGENLDINIKNKQIRNIPTLSLSDAVMHMDFESKKSYFFVNEENNKVTVLIKQDDGSISCAEIQKQ